MEDKREERSEEGSFKQFACKALPSPARSPFELGRVSAPTQKHNYIPRKTWPAATIVRLQLRMEVIDGSKIQITRTHTIQNLRSWRIRYAKNPGVQRPTTSLFIHPESL